MRNILLLIASLATTSIFSQDSIRITQAVRVNTPIKIDGALDEEGWTLAPLIMNLVEMRPQFGRIESHGTRSELKILYDDNAIYFGGRLFESTRDSISSELSGRDNVGVNDFIGIIFDTYQDKINGTGFYVTPLNEQLDLKYTIGSEDDSWNAVYTTETRIDDKGWVFEMRIPYSALRFSKDPTQNWNINIIRRRSKTGQQFSWSPVDPTKFGFMNQAGTITGFSNIEPPLRLSFSPYFSTYLRKDPRGTNDWETAVNGGMDVKYGISESFTMDMTLIPDFGQVQSDNLILNLTPFEVRYGENRPFFTEGFELFSKGNLFYSRRIGGQPIAFYDVYSKLNNGDTVLENPFDTKLINATKISGRTRKKLGIGFFNAITKPQHATIRRSDGSEYEIETSPVTNYNIIVLDQGLKNNSRVSLINTNVWRSGNYYDANVTALDWDLYDNKIDWNVWGQVNHSRLMGYPVAGGTEKGYLYNLYGGKFKGRFNFEVHRYYADDKYRQNDLGYFTNNNYVTHGFYTGYKWVKPKSFYNNIYLNLNGNYSQLYKPRRYQDFRLNGNVNGQLKNLWQAGINFNFRPKSNDFYEARMPGRVVKRPASIMNGFWLSTNRAKKFRSYIESYWSRNNEFKTSLLEIYTGNAYRFSDKLSVELNHQFNFSNNEYGFAHFAQMDSVIMGLRNRRTADNILYTRYSFNNKMQLTFRVRHYWSRVDYFKFYELQADGHPKDISSSSQNPDINLNIFNIDMNYTWEFAPGSFLNLNWKSSSDTHDRIIQEKYYDNFKKSIETPQLNSFSVKIIYYLDYLDLRAKFRKKDG